MSPWTTTASGRWHWPEGARELVSGVALGDDHALPADVRSDMRVVSMTHLTAVSGQHVAIVLGLIMSGLGVLPRRCRAAAGVVVLAALVALVRPGGSVLRAAAMGGVLLAGVAAGRRSASFPALCAAVTVLLLIDPWQARSYGFALSVVATAGILLGAAPAQEAPAQTQPDDETVRRWRLEAGLLLAERTRALSSGPAVRLPEHLAATRLDDLRADRRRFALDLRRPLPPEPRAAGRLGTVFHDAVAQLLSARGTLFGLGEAGVPDNLDPQDRQRVERWLGTVENLALLDDYVLVDTEIDREITIGATTLRCRMDAVFRRLDGSGWLIVDWKTGRRQVPVDQLSVYVHAWAASQGVSAGSVRAAYVYVDYPGGRVDELAAAGLLSLDRIESALTAG